jgi:uncharacterized protein with ParB-like and HNH nuclease domain
MSYQKITISQIVQKANESRICLPAIQRKYVWDSEQVEGLFDSIYRDYPIGTFLFWEMGKETRNNYKLYRLLNEHDDSKGAFNVLYPMPDMGNNELWSILDGQQRLTSIYLALQYYFRYSVKTGKNKRFEDKYLYFNLAGLKPENPATIIFSIRTEKKSKESNDGAWVLVKDFLRSEWKKTLTPGIEGAVKIKDFLKSHPQYENIIKPLIEGGDEEVRNENRRLIERHIERLLKMLHKDELISYYLINEEVDISSVTEIFIRINSGGTVLSKSDLLFSTVISSWQDGRKAIDELIQELSMLGYSVDTDFIMRTCLYLSNENILFKVNSFKENVVEKIIKLFLPEEGMGIRTAIYQTYHLLKTKLNLPDKLLKSKNSIIPIIYHIYNGGKTCNESINEIRKYIYVSQLQKIFGSHGDNLLTQLRYGVTDNNEYKFKNEKFNFNTLVSGVTEQNKKLLFNITKEVIDNWLSLEKGAESWMVLSLIYENHNYGYIAYDQDHLHPRSKFTRNNLGENYKTANKLRDTLPNLCFLTPEENRGEKKACLLEDYLKKMNGEERNSFMQRNHFPQGCNISIDSFLDFYELRRDLLSNKLLNIFNVNPSSVEIDSDSTEKETPDEILIDQEDTIQTFNHDIAIENDSSTNGIIGIDIEDKFAYIIDDTKGFDDLFNNFKYFILSNYAYQLKLSDQFKNIFDKAVADDQKLKIMSKISYYLKLGTIKFLYRKI